MKNLMQMLKISLISIIVIFSTLTSAQNNLYHNNELKDALQQDLAQQINPKTQQYFDKKNHAYVLRMQLPALYKNNLSVEHQDGYLIVQSRQETQQKNHYTAGYFYQKFSIPNDADTNNIGAKFKHHVLIVRLPKITRPDALTHQINIK
jgi:HSP20 family molecular chaperone IbpA